jgi:hypothetical protein
MKSGPKEIDCCPISSRNTKSGSEEGYSNDCNMAMMTDNVCNNSNTKKAILTIVIRISLMWVNTSCSPSRRHGTHVMRHGSVAVGDTH